MIWDGRVLGIQMRVRDWDCAWKTEIIVGVWADVEKTMEAAVFGTKVVYGKSVVLVRKDAKEFEVGV